VRARAAGRVQSLGAQARAANLRGAAALHADGKREGHGELSTSGKILDRPAGPMWLQHGSPGAISNATCEY
jgi:hypothetical protein